MATATFFPTVSYLSLYEPRDSKTPPLSRSVAEEPVTHTPPDFPSKSFFLTRKVVPSFFSLRLHPAFTGQSHANLFYQWGVAMTFCARRYHLLTLESFLKLDRDHESTVFFKALNKVVGCNTSLHRIIGTDLCTFLSKGYDGLSQIRFSCLHPSIDPEFVISPLIESELTLESRIPFKFHLKQLGVDKGKFADLLYLPSAVCQSSVKPPFKMEAALLMEYIYYIVKKDPKLLNDVKKRGFLVQTILDQMEIASHFKNRGLYDRTVLNEVANHMESSLLDWNQYCYKILKGSGSNFFQKIEDYDFNTLIESIRHKLRDLRLSPQSKDIIALEELKKIYELYLKDDDDRGSLQMVFYQFHTKEPDPRLIAWIEGKSRLNSEHTNLILEQLDIYLAKLPLLTPELRTLVLQMLCNSLYDWDKFVAKTLNIANLVAC
jgi:hypothetical protein